MCVRGMIKKKFALEFGLTNEQVEASLRRLQEKESGRMNQMMTIQHEDQALRMK